MFQKLWLALANGPRFGDDGRPTTRPGGLPPSEWSTEPSLEEKRDVFERWLLRVVSVVYLILVVLFWVYLPTRLLFWIFS